MTNILAEISLSSMMTSLGLFMMMETPRWTPATVQLVKRAEPCVLKPKPVRPPEIRVLTTWPQPPSWTIIPAKWLKWKIKGAETVHSGLGTRQWYVTFTTTATFWNEGMLWAINWRWRKAFPGVILHYNHCACSNSKNLGDNGEV